MNPLHLFLMSTIAGTAAAIMLRASICDTKTAFWSGVGITQLVGVGLWFVEGVDMSAFAPY